VKKLKVQRGRISLAVWRTSRDEPDKSGKDRMNWISLPKRRTPELA
jgi:hypothetical protein